MGQDLVKENNVTNANSKQVGGLHYKTTSGVQHWDLCIDHGIGYLEAAATKYICRHPNKNGKQDLEKALHYAEKLLECFDQGRIKRARGVVPLFKIVEFSRQYDLGSHEDAACCFLFTWGARRDIENAIGAIKRAIDKPQQARERIDNTGQKHPFGFNASEEVKD